MEPRAGDRRCGGRRASGVAALGSLASRGLLAALLAVALLSRAAGAAPKTVYGGLRTAQAQERHLASQLAAIDLGVVRAEDRLARLQAQAGVDRARQQAMARQATGLQASLASEQGTVDGVVRFLAEGGLLSFAAVLLRAGSFGDFLTRLTYLQYILGFDIRTLRSVEAQRRSLATAQGAAAAAGRLATQDVAKAHAELADLTRLRQSRAAALAQAQRRAAQLGAQLVSLDQALLRGLPALSYLLDHFSGLPWSSIAPDSERLDLATRSVVAAFDQATVDRVLARQPRLAGLEFRLVPGRVEAVAKSSGIVLYGPMVPDGAAQLRWKPDGLQVGGVPAPPSLLASLLAGRSLIFSIPTPASQVHLLGATERPGELDLTFGF